jgi:tRNA pseudouridine38-40 synthase
MALKRWKLTLEYDGSAFSGWQRQEAGIASVQETVERAIHDFCQQDVTLHVAGRTDAGVHASGQIAHVDLDIDDKYEGFMVVKAINAQMREAAVAVIGASIVAPDFHARFHAINKLYTYRLMCRSAPLVLERKRGWVLHHSLDVAAMQEGARHLLGYHDFTTFRDSDCQAKTPFRTLDRLDIESMPYDGVGAMEIRIHAEAKSFLHHQVRNMVGTLVQVGMKRWQPDDMLAALLACDRTRGGPTAPPDGLCLVRVDYPVVDTVVSR